MIDGIEYESAKTRSRKKLIEDMENGFDGGKVLYKHRSELYGRG